MQAGGMGSITHARMKYLRCISNAGAIPSGARAAGRSGDPSVLADLEALLERLARGLPTDLREEAGPWLAKLARARDVIAARFGGAGAETMAARWAAYESEGAEVLGDWFEP